MNAEKKDKFTLYGPFAQIVQNNLELTTTGSIN